MAPVAFYWQALPLRGSNGVVPGAKSLGHRQLADSSDLNSDPYPTQIRLTHVPPSWFPSAIASLKWILILILIRTRPALLSV